MPSEDITFCGYNKCPMTNCFRNQANIKNPNALHSFAYFDDCPTHQKALEDLRSTVGDIED